MDSKFLIPQSVNEIVTEIRKRCSSKESSSAFATKYLKFYKRYRFAGKSLKVKVNYNTLTYNSSHIVEGDYDTGKADVLEVNLVLKINKTSRNKFTKLFEAPLGEIQKTIKYINGDLLELDKNFDVIAHGCNCFQTMGSGIARSIRAKYPEAYDIDKACKLTPKKRLGTIKSTVTQLNPIVVDAYTQFDFGQEKMNVDYKAVRSCMKAIAEQYQGKRIGLPQIGAGLAGGNWDIIEGIIEEELIGEDVTVVIFKNGSRD